MTRRIAILNVDPNTNTFTVGSHPDNTAGDWRGIFQGRYYRDPAALSATEKPPTWGGFRQELYVGPAPSGWQTIEATSFDVVDNPTFNGRYTVHTPLNNTESSSLFSASQTTVRVVQDLPNPGPSHPDLTAGFITNVTTYYINTNLPGFGGYFLIPPETSVTVNGSEYVGYRSAGWGEAIQQTVHRVVSSVSATISITTPSTTWTAVHDLSLSSPYLVTASFFWDDAGTIKQIFPASVTYAANEIVATFSTAIAGFVLIRS